jgi:hypothetical protein
MDNTEAKRCVMTAFLHCSQLVHTKCSFKQLLAEEKFNNASALFKKFKERTVTVRTTVIKGKSSISEIFVQDEIMVSQQRYHIHKMKYIYLCAILCSMYLNLRT